MIRVAGIVAVAVVLLGCSGTGVEESEKDFMIKNLYCDKSFPGEDSGNVVGVFKCVGKYRLVFEANDHLDYYIDEKGAYIASCPQGYNNDECKSFLGNCSLINLCRG